MNRDKTVDPSDNKAAREHVALMEAIVEGIGKAGLVHAGTPQNPAVRPPTVDDALLVKVALTSAGFRLTRAPAK